ncbi:ABC transporter permease [Flavisolibacter ginsenosidimutans]|uniref:ABC transporter permease n=1 Tax=Flavisolibacter ginsenosidimutans TaxID=661481 RepID=A0A5B8UKC3_9BACT|nr:ABC transporter permease [Flavisolibacter ginsenosidimutans]QEC57013.1 ABC transporter permease [Flavisolibacter ginsenosidimutans]
MWTLTRLELFKIFKKPRTYIAFAAIALIIGLIQLAMKADGESYMEFMLQNINTAFDIEGKKLNGYFVFYLILHTLLVHVPLLICLVAGDVVAGEANMGTLRLLVTKPVSRTQLMLSKFFASSIYTLGLLTFMAVMGLLGSVVLFGVSDLMVQKSDQFILLNSNDVLWRYVAAYGFAALSMITVASIAFLFSVFADNSIGPIVGAMSVVIVMTILTTMDIPIFNVLKPYLFTNHMLNWKGFFDNPVDYREVLKSAGILLFHIALFVSLAVWFFRKKDILS